MVALHDFDGLEGCGAGERVAAERAADRAGRRSFHDFLTRDDGRERHAGGDGFRRCDDIRLDTRFLPIFGSEHASRAAEAGLDFVCHEQDALLVADLADGLDPLDWRGDEAAFALQRLDDSGRDVLGRAALLKDLVELLDVVIDGLVIRHASRLAVEVWELGAIDAIGERAHADGIGFLRRHRHRHQRAAVERAGEHDDVRALRERLCNLDGILVGLGAAVREIGFLLAAAHRCNLRELFGERDIAFMRHDVEHAVEIFLGLLLDGRNDLGMAMADVQHADAADPVEEMVAVEVFDDGTFGALHDDRIAAMDGARHDGLAALDDLGGFRARQSGRDDFWQCVSEHNKFLHKNAIRRCPARNFLWRTAPLPYRGYLLFSCCIYLSTKNVHVLRAPCPIFTDTVVLSAQMR